MDKKELLKDLRHRMDGAMNVLEGDLRGLSTGRASVHLVDPVMVEAYGSKMHISQLGSVSTPDARTVAVQVWDASMVKTVEKAIADANLGVNTATDGNIIRLPIPQLNEERRKELAKLAHKYGENSKISVRNIRRDGIEHVKKLEKEDHLPEDEVHGINDEIQKITDEYVSKIDSQIKIKEQEIMSV
ncbi:MAG: ribosome recycling factor [Pseudomonadota bacterium]|jgi:ribosome recycling factor